VALDRVAAELDQYVGAWLAQVAAPGAAVVVTDATDTLHLSVHGFRDAFARTPVSEEDRFQIGSVSKAFASFAAMRLQEQGRLSIDDPVRAHLPWFEVRSSYEPILVWHLMTHSAGIINGTDWTGEGEYEIRSLRETEATAPPGELYHYSNAGYKALGLVLEVLWGMPVADVLAREVFAPLGMESTVGSITNADRRRQAPAHVPYYDDRAWRPAHGVAPAPWVESTTADGSIASTAADMARYLRMLLNRGRGEASDVVTQDSFSLMLDRSVESPEYEHDSRYGLGLLLTEDGGDHWIRHGGSMVGHTCGMRVNVEAGLGVMVLTNGDCDSASVQTYALGLVRADRDGSAPPPPPPLPDEVRDGARYAGTYASADGGSIEVAAADRVLTVSLDGAPAVRLLRGDDEAFVADSDDWEPFPLHFKTVGNRVTGLAHGASLYVPEGAAPPSAGVGGWSAFEGHYRTHDPWYSNFRIVDRAGALVLIWGWGVEEPLERLPDGSFRAGEDPRMPERVRFEERDDGGPVLRVNYSGLDLFRVFTP
jgi:D-alanyl-D-alanine carboxypeptidase